MKRVLFVCTGNICRSPTAEGVFRHLIAEAGLGHAIESASAGTHGYHIGEPPDPRSVAAAKRRGFDLSAQRARKVRADDFHTYDLILAMDRDHFAHLESLRPNNARAEVKLFLEYHSDAKHRDVPDPYYGGPDGFEQVLDMIEHASKVLLGQIAASLKAR
ncbi:MAG: low molecular weight protein-tyrosine-phosphatase [Rhodospirillaceae bacterium]